MRKYEEKLLISLVEKYRRSKKDSGTNRVSRRTQIRPDILYGSYSKNDADPEQIEEVNATVKYCADKGYLTYEMRGFGNEISKIYLVDEKVDEIEQYLEAGGGYLSKDAKRRQVLAIIENYEGSSPVVDFECEKMRQILASNRIPRDYEKDAEVLKALKFIENNTRLLYIREASMLIYGKSKYLEENTLDAVCRLIRDYYGEPCGEDEMPDEILKKYNIVKEEQKLCLKGPVTICLKGREVDVGAFGDGIEFSGSETDDITDIRIRTHKFMTVENRTPYLRSSRPDIVYCYLGGYANRFQRDLLKKIYECNPNISFLHFGDIDAGGFAIHEHLCRITGIPFEMYRMSVSELEDERFAGCLQQLTGEDKKRLGILKEQEQYRNTAEYMLGHNVKLEQEIVQLYSEES